MALDPQLAQFKSPGIERLEFDKSQTVSIPAEQIRLIVGFSKKGPFNTPVFIPDAGFFVTVFGDIDRSLEKKASFFHRTCLAALERGPILTLNLLRLDNDDDDGFADKVENIVFSTSSTALNLGKNQQLFSGYFNKEKFWFPEDDSFLNNISSISDSTNKLLNLVNLGTKPLSVIVTKAKPANTVGFDVTVKEWFGVSNVPDALHPDDLISDFLIDVIVLEGNFGARITDATPYERFASDPLFAKFFDKSKGIKRKKSVLDTEDTSLDEFLNLPEVSVLATYTGSLIPDFVDLIGSNLFIQDIINIETPATGLFCAIDRTLFDDGQLVSGVDGGIDLIGHNLEFEQPTTIDFLSYKDTIKTDLTYSENASVLKTVSIENAVFEDNSAGNLQITVNVIDNQALYDAIASTDFIANELSPRVVGSFVQITDTGSSFTDDFAAVISKTVTASSAIIELSGVTTSDFSDIHGGDDIGDSSKVLTYMNEDDLDWVVDNSDTSYISTPAIISGVASQLSSDAINGILTDGDRAVYSVLTNILHLDFTITNVDFDLIHYDNLGTILEGSIINGSTWYIPIVQIDAYQDEDFLSQELNSANFGLDSPYFDSSDVPGIAGDLIVQTLKGSLNETVLAGAGLIPNEVIVDTAFGDAIEVGKYLVADTGGTSGPSRLTRIIKVAAAGTDIVVTCQGKILIRNIGGDSTVEVYAPATEWVDHYEVFNLTGFSHRTFHLPNNTQEQQNNILFDTLSGTNLFRALVDRDNITFRYIIDSFGLGIEASSKFILANLAKERQNVLAILNAPSLKDFRNSTDPLFLDLEGAVSTKFIAEGGDLSKNPNVVYTMPGITQGSNYAAFYGPYLVVRDRGRNITVPPAGFVSNNFIDKYTSALPWSIVAGARRGIVAGRGVIGVETNFSKGDRDNIEPFGINPIIFQSGIGIVIFGNKTAQQNIKSALSSVHVREVLIFIQDGIAAILRNFLFEFNTPQTRLEIKTLADNFLATVQADDGVFDFRNIMDETNNTPEVIDQNIGILDTFVEPVKGLEILVHRTTILKTGQISTGEFV